MASKVPDDKFIIVANDMVTDYADLSDRANFRGTADLKEFAVKHGFAVYGGADEGVHAGDVNLAASYGENNTKYNTGRRWRGYNLFAPSKKIAMLGYGDSDKTYPMFVTPDRKISAEAVMQFQRDRYQGTPYDLSLAPRVTTLNPEGYDIKETLFYDGAASSAGGSDADRTKTLRPIGFNTQMHTHIVELLPELPPEIGARMWIAMAQSEHSVNLPLYGLIADTCKYDKTVSDKYVPDSSYWQFQNVAYYCRYDRAKYGKAVQEYWRAYELKLSEEQREVEAKMLALYKKDPALARCYITAYVLDTREKAAERAREIRSALLEHIKNSPDGIFKID